MKTLKSLKQNTSSFLKGYLVAHLVLVLIFFWCAKYTPFLKIIQIDYSAVTKILMEKQK